MTTVRNNGSISAKDVEATLYLPHGLAFATGSATQDVGTLAAGEERQVSWDVRATGLSEDATLTYFIVAAASNAVAPTVAKEIVVPRLLNVFKLSPNIGGNAGNITVTLQGSGFKDGAVVRLGDLVGKNTTIISPEQVQTTFDLLGQSPGTRQIEIENPGGEMAAAPEPFTIVDGGGEHLRIDLVGPSFVRVGTHQPLTEVPFYLIVRNEGLVDAENVVIELNAEADPNSSPATSPTQAAAMFPPPPPPPPSPIKLPFNSKKLFTLPKIPPLGGSVAQPGKAQGVANNCVNVEARNACAAERQKVAFAKRQVAIAANRWLIAAAKLSLCSGGRIACAALIAEERLAKQALDLALDQLRVEQEELDRCLRSVQAGQPAAGGANASLGTCSVGSADPNDKFGTSGSGDAQYVSGNSPLPYNVLFENKPEATAPAQEVVVTDQLDVEKFDLSTFSLGLIAFGDTQVEPPPGVQQFSTDVDLRPANNLIVRINAGLDGATGIVTWRFISLDPSTGLPTTDALAGFLPPNKNAPEGEGSVLYTVMPKENLLTGTEIRNRAVIVFDTNLPIETPEWVNTLDNSSPTSQVLPLAGTQSTTDFEVHWSGTDIDSGIRDYTIFVSEDGGVFIPWLINTTDTSGTYSGVDGHTYAFYSVAQDQTGNVEDAPTIPDATTQVGGADQCPNDPNKTEPGVCGCGVPDTDSDLDGTPNCNDQCPNDPARTVPSPEICGDGIDQDCNGADSVCPPPPPVDTCTPTTVLDNFNRADGSVGNNWRGVRERASIVSQGSA